MRRPCSKSHTILIFRLQVGPNFEIVFFFRLDDDFQPARPLPNPIGHTILIFRLAVQGFLAGIVYIPAKRTLQNNKF